MASSRAGSEKKLNIPKHVKRASRWSLSFLSLQTVSVRQVTFILQQKKRPIACFDAVLHARSLVHSAKRRRQVSEAKAT
jgi:hypothetical protein